QLEVTPATDSTEPINFDYTVEDEDGLTDTGNVDITFTQLPPVADDDSANTGAGETVNLNALDGDDDPDGDNANLTITEIIDPDGTVTPIAPLSTVTLSDGTMVTLQTNGTLDVTPGPDVTEINFDYTVEDEDGLTDIGNVVVTVIFDCDDIVSGTIDVCSILTSDPSNPIGLLDCDGDGEDNATECTNNTNPTDPCSNNGTGIADTSNPIYAAADCDGDGEDNGTEIANGTDPTNPCEGGDLANVDLMNTTSDWYTADCDG
ncbi:Ig-like domain-containing protein, partial [Winogradskyella litorisediminis]